MTRLYMKTLLLGVVRCLLNFVNFVEELKLKIDIIIQKKYMYMYAHEIYQLRACEIVSGRLF